MTRTVSLPEYASGQETSQETNMIRTFSRQVLSGKLDPSWGEITLKTQKVLDACLQSALKNSVVVTL